MLDHALYFVGGLVVGATSCLCAVTLAIDRLGILLARRRRLSGKS